MFKKLENYRHNWILVLAIGLVAVFGLMNLFLDVKPPMGRVNQFDSIPILGLLIFGSVIAPVLEELSFRGFFSNSNKLRVLALIGFLSYTGFVFYSKYSATFAVFNTLIFLVLITLCTKFKSNIIFALFVITNAVVFGLIHYSAEDFSNGSYPFVLIQTVLGLFLTWITINSKLSIAMIFHGTWNLIALSITLASLQFVLEEKTVIEKDNMKITYQQVPVLGSNATTVTNESDKVIGKNVTIKTLLDLALIEPNLKDKYSSVIPMARYDFTIEFKDEKRDFEKVLKILQEKEMVMKN
ncbi:MAG TPA: CPBP family intramembrane glutamic endopeptidase [Flavobacterium sp.]|uniref:CPBP family intramembrane glutamic endopeptidase n=1 Tax=Flavobacterium sp. TaxID=239 RepID=UPI002CFECCE8|nr:CPBP family intramembrane glutamic endopeptidase [Flavobacterium sp.]HSD15472.1 CPBP family intramembrane glutamic endopeptidase [Flavobacterium sp.]